MVGRIEVSSTNAAKADRYVGRLAVSSDTVSLDVRRGQRAPEGNPPMAYRVLSEAELLNEKSMGPGVKGVRLALSLEVLEQDGWVLVATTAEGLYVFRRPE